MGPLRDYLYTNRASAGEPDRDAVLLQVVQKAAAFTRADACLLLLPDEHGVARVGAAVGGEAQPLQAFRAPLDEALGAAARELLGFRPGDTFLGVPVAIEGRMLGVLAVFRRTSRPPPEDEQALEEALVLALADQAAIVLEHTARRRRAEEAAAAAEATESKFRSLIETAPDPIIIVDEEARIILMKRGSGALLSV